MKLQILLEKKSITDLAQDRRKIVIGMIAGMVIPTVILCAVTQYDVGTLWAQLDFSGTINFYESLRIVK